MNLRATTVFHRWRASVWTSCNEASKIQRASRHLFRNSLLTIKFILIASSYAASASTADLCDKAAHQAASELGVPFPVLWSITRTETGRSQNGQLSPWPWTVNMEGKGLWFKTRQEAKAYAKREFERGARSFDIGCFQINYKWHGASFRSIDQMFDPVENARYAAAFLARLYRESGDWSTAAGAFHSRIPKFSKLYRTRFDKIRRKYQPNGTTPAGNYSNTARQYASDTPSHRENTYPLLTHTGKSSGNGSLVPISNKQARALFVIPGSGGES